MKHILYLSYDGVTEPLGYSQIICYLKGLSACGYSFTLISFEKPDRMALQGKQVEAELTALDIRWIPLRYRNIQRFLSTFDRLYTLEKISRKLCRTHPPALIHSRSYMTALVALRLKRKFNIPFLFDMRAFFADERRESGSWPANHPLLGRVYNFFKKKEQSFLEEAAGIISLTQKGKSVIRSWQHLKGQPLPISVIPCAADLQHFNPENTTKLQLETLRKSLQLQGKYVLLYVGSLSRYLLLPMMQFFKALKTIQTNAVFLFLTHEAPEMLHADAQKAGLSATDLHIRSVERSEMPQYMLLANAAIFFAQKGLGKTIYSPIKMGELMAMGIPIVCNSGLGDSDAIIKKYNAGIVVDDFEKNTLKKAAVLLKNTTFDSAEIQTGARAVYALSEGVRRYDAAYAQILERSATHNDSTSDHKQ